MHCRDGLPPGAPLRHVHRASLRKPEPLCAAYNGMELHAATTVPAKSTDALENVCPCFASSALRFPGAAGALLSQVCQQLWDFPGGRLCRRPAPTMLMVPVHALVWLRKRRNGRVRVFAGGTVAGGQALT
ncbi:MAG: hypothetical protein AMXMBFR64_61920 [Myxococcales bacterium]